MNWGDARLPERFWNKVVPCPMSGCWLWIGSINEKGYGKISTTRRGGPWLAHRFAFVALSAPIPDRLVLDHRVCATPCCVNPAHLEVVTRTENFLRWARTVTSCPRGHQYTPENTYRRKHNGTRICRTCNRERQRTQCNA